MTKFVKNTLIFLIALTLLLGLTACGKGKDDDKDNVSPGTTEGTTAEVTDPDYNVEDDLVEGILTDEMLAEMDKQEDASTEEEKKDDDKKEDDKKDEAPKPNLKKFYIKVNRQTNVVTVYTYDEKGNYTKPVKAMVCSTGRNNGTPKGVFKMSSKHRWQLMFGGVYSQYASRIDGHILFHSVPYREAKSNTLITNYYNQLGRQASDGCVRLNSADAKWIYSNCASGTKVEIFDGGSGSDPLGKPSSIRIPTNSPYKTWDPTDPVENNPWKNAKPTVTASNRTVELGSGNVNLLEGVKATDAYGQTITPDVSGNVDTKKAGIYSVTYSVESNGKKAQTTITITVKDTKAPTITHKLSGIEYKGTVSESAVKEYVQKNVTVSDESGTGKVTGITVSITENKIVCTVSAADAAGNKTQAVINMKLTPATTEPEPPTTGTTTEQESTTTTEQEKPTTGTTAPETPTTDTTEQEKPTTGTTTDGTTATTTEAATATTEAATEAVSQEVTSPVSSEPENHTEA